MRPTPAQAMRRDDLAIEYAQNQNGTISDPEIAAEIHFSAGYDAAFKELIAPMYEVEGNNKRELFAALFALPMLLARERKDPSMIETTIVDDLEAAIIQAQMFIGLLDKMKPKDAESNTDYKKEQP